MGKLEIYAGIDDAKNQTVLLGEHVDGRAAVEIIQNHLCRNFAGISADAFGGRAVVAGENDDGRMFQARRQRILNQANAQSQDLQLAQRPQRFGFLIDFLLQRRLQCAINRCDGKMHR